METGLSSAEAAKRLQEYGPNDIKEEEESPAVEFLKWFAKPTSLMMELALALSYAAGDLQDAEIIFILLLVNVAISFYHEHRAGNAIRALKESVGLSASVVRDGRQQDIDARGLVPGDILLLERGDIVPADAAVFKCSGLELDQSMLTGESEPVEGRVGQLLYSASIVKAGSAMCRVGATGGSTYFGKAIRLVAKSEKQSVIERDILSVTKFLMAVGLACIAVVSGYFFLAHKPMLRVLSLSVSIAIVSFPIALPTVVALVTSIGMLDLSKKGVVVRRLAALEDLSNVDVLFTDKTGTITRNEMAVDGVIPWGRKKAEVVRLAYACSDWAGHDVIDGAVVRYARENADLSGIRVLDYQPAAPETKKALASAMIGGKRAVIMKGATSVVGPICALSGKEKERFDAGVKMHSDAGYKTLAVAWKEKGKFRLAGILLIRDPPRADARKSILYLRAHGISVKMLTGDNRHIARSIAMKVGIGSRVAVRGSIANADASVVAGSDVFAELFPSDKFGLVRAAKARYVTAVTGDGVNDVPAIREATVGIAVSNASDAAKSSADVFLLSPGISVISDAVIESKKIMEKIYYYSVYRISESFRLLLTILFAAIFLGEFPMAPLQLILLSLLNDLPIVAIAFDRVKIPHDPEKIDLYRRTARSVVFGLIGLFNSLLFIYLALYYFKMPVGQIQSALFLKLSIGGHLLLLVVRTMERWYRFLPSRELLLAIVGTQLVAVLIVSTGFLMPALPPWVVLFVLFYAFFWMQVSELSKGLYARRRA